jgi:HTH-type transcriptional regulator/antitoxin HipB
MDDLDQYIVERTKKDPEFEASVNAVEQRILFARKMAKQRMKLDLTQTQFAARMGSSTSVVTRIENGKDVKVSSIQRYATALGQKIKFQLKNVDA